jgi:YHS domain-containing protein
MAAIMRQERKENLTLRALLAVLVPIFLLCGGAEAAVAREPLPPVIDPLTGVAIGGYDPVAYFTEGAPVRGSSAFEHRWAGVSWYFASAANRDVFAGHPEIYAPQFGGHCAMALARGYLSDGDGRLFALRELKLYLFYSAANREAFLASDNAAIAEAEGRWRAINGEAVATAEADAVPVPSVSAAH